VTVFQVRERAAEIAAAPIGFLRDFGSDFLGQLRIIGKDDHRRAFVPERQTAIVIRGSRFAWLDVYGAVAKGSGLSRNHRKKVSNLHQSLNRAHPPNVDSWLGLSADRSLPVAGGDPPALAVW